MSNIVANMPEEKFLSNYYEHNYNLRYFEMNNNGVASPITILTLLEETAAEHCRSIGYDLYSLEKQNIGWILISGVIEMIRYPRYKENITIRTWMSKISLVRGYRENYIFDGEKNIIGKARGIWVFYDIQKRRPVPIFEDIKESWGGRHEISAEENYDILDKIYDSSLEIDFNIYRSDVDNYKHLNNIRYFDFLLESLPEKIADNYSLKTINAKFIAEAIYGERIQVCITGDLGNSEFMHTIKSHTDGKILAKAHTQWEVSK